MFTQEMVTVLLIALAVNAVIIVSLLAWPTVRRWSRNRSADRTSATRFETAQPTRDPGAQAGEPWFLTPSVEVAAHGQRLGRPGERAGVDEPGVPAPVALPPMATPAAWAAWLDEEAARTARYQRPATIVLIELAGLDRLAERVGRAAADRLVPPIAATIHRHARASDRLARLDATRFGVLLVETDEVSAINYVERIRGQCDVWLAAGAVNLRLSVGWAEVRADGGREAAMRVAEKRLFDDRRRTEPVEVAAEADGRDGLSAVLQATGS